MSCVEKWKLAEEAKEQLHRSLHRSESLQALSGPGTPTPQLSQSSPTALLLASSGASVTPSSSPHPSEP